MKHSIRLSLIIGIILAGAPLMGARLKNAVAGTAHVFGRAAAKNAHTVIPTLATGSLGGGVQPPKKSSLRVAGSSAFVQPNTQVTSHSNNPPSAASIALQATARQKKFFRFQNTNPLAPVAAPAAAAPTTPATSASNSASNSAAAPATSSSSDSSAAEASNSSLPAASAVQETAAVEGDFVPREARVMADALADMPTSYGDGIQALWSNFVGKPEPAKSKPKSQPAQTPTEPTVGRTNRAALDRMDRDSATRSAAIPKPKLAEKSLPKIEQPPKNDGVSSELQALGNAQPAADAQQPAPVRADALAVAPKAIPEVASEGSDVQPKAADIVAIKKAAANPTRAAKAGKGPQIKMAEKMAEDLARMMADIFKQTQTSPKANKADSAIRVVQPLQQLAGLGKSAAKQNLKTCIVGVDFIRQTLGGNFHGPTILTDTHNNILGVIGKPNAQGFVPCLFTEPVVTKLMRTMLTAPGSTGKLEGVYRPRVSGKSAIARVTQAQQPDIFVLLTKNDGLLKRNITQVLNGLNNPAFAQNQFAFNIPSIAIVRSGNRVPVLTAVMDSGRSLKDVSQAAVEVEPEVPEHSPVNEPVDNTPKNPFEPVAQPEIAANVNPNSTPALSSAAPQAMPSAPKKSVPQAQTPTQRQPVQRVVIGQDMARNMATFVPVAGVGLASVSESVAPKGAASQASAQPAAPQPTAQPAAQAQAESASKPQAQKRVFRASSRYDAVKKANEAFKAAHGNGVAAAQPAAEPAQAQAESGSAPQSKKFDGLKRSAQAQPEKAEVKVPKVEKAASGIQAKSKPKAPKRAAPKAPARPNVDPVDPKAKRTRPTVKQNKQHGQGPAKEFRTPDEHHRPNVQPPMGDDDLFDFYEISGVRPPVYVERAGDPDPEPTTLEHCRGGCSGVMPPPVVEAETMQNPNNNNNNEQQQNAKTAPAKKEEPAVESKEAETKDVNKKDPSKPPYSYEPDSNYNPGYDPIESGQAKPSGPTAQSRVPNRARSDAQVTGPQGMPPAPGNGTGAAAPQGAQSGGMDLRDTKLGKFDAYGRPLVEGNKKTKVNTPQNQTQVMHGMQPDRQQQQQQEQPMLQEVTATAEQSMPAPTTAGILSIIGMILTIIVSSLLRVVFAPFRFF